MIKSKLKKLASLISPSFQTQYKDERELLAIGTLLSHQQFTYTSQNFNDYEFKIFSQYGDDGLIQYLIKHIRIENETFIEFGVGDYSESNTRFLLMNNNWSGFVMDGSDENMNKLKTKNWLWKYDLRFQAEFIDKDNINNLLATTAYQNLGLLHIDIDGNDYYILDALDFSILNPSILIMEYNSVFGSDRSISTLYDPDFNRTRAHFSNLYFGASLGALTYLANKKGYKLVGSNLAGNNAFFIRNDLMYEKIPEVSVERAYKYSRFRESRNPDYSLSMLSGESRLNAIKGLKVLNVITGEIEII